MRPAVQVRRVRPADLDDLDGLDGVVEVVLRARAESSVGPQLCTADPVALLRQLATLVAAQDGHLLRASADGEPCGVLLARVLPPGLFTDVPAVYIEGLYVDAEYRRRGVGHALVSGAADIARSVGAEDVYALPLPGARAMQRFLARLGFAPAAAHRVVNTSALVRRLGEEPGSSLAARAPRSLDALIVRRRRARAASPVATLPYSA